MKWRQYGDPLDTPQVATVEERFWAKVDKNGSVPAHRPDLGPCWEWGAFRSPDGYGKFSYPGGQLAHRYAYELLVGPIPVGRQPDHLCRNRGCVNPAHLEPVTPYENLMRGSNFSAENARKTRCPHGHEYTPENTYVNSKGSRECVICRRDNGRRGSRRYRALH